MAADASPPRVVLVEDDIALRQFVRLALEDVPLDLVECDGVAAALAALRAAPARLVVTDLGLADGSGLTLLERLADDPGLRAEARLVVFSAGLTATVKARLQALGVWRMLPKPVPLAELERCVQDALRGEGGQVPDPAAALVEAGAGAGADDVAAAVASHFGGDRDLYEAFRGFCLAQLPRDIDAGDAACATAQGAALQRVAHNLKSALRSLGQAGLAELAAEVERRAEAGDLPKAEAAWQALRGGLRTSLGSDAQS